MKRLASKRTKIIILLGITVLVFALWQIGWEPFHARILVGGTNACLSLVGSNYSIKYEMEDGKAIFRVYHVIGAEGTRFPQEIGPLLQPTVIILSWQLFLFFVLSRRQALRLLLINLGIFVACQIFFLINLTGFHTSVFQKFMYNLMIDSFYIIALILVIKDNIFYPVFRKS